MKFTAKLISAFVLTALIPVALLGHLSYTSARDALEKQALEDLTLIADAVESHLYTFFELTKGRVSDFSSDGFIRDASEAILALDARDPRFENLQKSLNAHLKRNKLPLDKSIRLISVLDMNGKVIASTDKREVGRDESGHGFSSLGEKSVSIGDVHFGQHGEASDYPYHLHAAALVTGRETGARLGVIINFYSTLELNNILSGNFHMDTDAKTSHPEVTKPINIYLVNRNKTLITPSRGGGELMKQKVETVPVLECASGREMTALYKNYLGKEVLGASMCVPMLGWTLLAEIDAKEAFAPVESLKNRIIVLSLAIGLFAFFLAYLLAKESRRSLQAETSRLEALIRGMKEGVVFADAQDSVALLNPAAEDIFGVTLAEVRNTPLRYCNPCNMEQFNQNIREIREGKRKYFSGEAFYRDRQFEITISPIRRNADYLGTVMVLHDITARKRTDEALRETSEFLRAIIQSSPLAIVALDPSENVKVWSKAAERLFGWSAHEVLGRSLPIIPDDRQAEFHALCERVLQGKLLSEIDLQRQRKDGALVDVRISAAPLFDAQAKVSGIIAIVADYTSQKKLENQFRHAQKMEAVGQLAGGIAHDFNNILTAIIGYGSILRMKIQDNQQREHVESILASAERAANLTKSLLAFSRTQVLSPKPSNINGIITGIKGLLERMIGEDIGLTIKPGAADMVVFVDTGQIEQVLMNLTTNARDAMPDGGLLTIETGILQLDNEYIRAHSYGEPGEYAVISVTDTGIGMDEKILKRIFEPFFTTKEVGKGTGLGLSMAYGMIKQHKGYIDVSSEPGKGTIVKIYLPRIKTAADGAARPRELRSFTGGSETILVLEDDEAVRKLTKNILEEAGYKVIEASNGEEALNKFKENANSVHLLLLDVITPRKNGKIVYEEIRRTHPSMKTLFMSGYAANVIHDKGILEKELHFISKPVSPDELLRMVRTVLDT